MISSQSFYAAVVRGLGFLGKETARNPFVVVAVVCDTFTAFAVARAVISARAFSFVITSLRHCCCFLSVINAQ